MVDENQHGMVARKTVLAQNGFVVVTATTAEGGLEVFDSRPIDLVVVVTDYRMKGMDGKTFIAHLHSRCAALPIILLSGFVEMLGLDERSTGADAVLAKCPTEAMSLVRTVNRLLTRRTLKKPMKRETGVRTTAASNVG